MSRRVMCAAFFVLYGLLARPSYAPAQCVQFEDLPLGATYFFGDTFVSSGVQVTHWPFQWSNGVWTATGSSRVTNDGHAGGSGQEMFVSNVNMEFDFGYPLLNLALLFRDSGGNLNIQVNGEFKEFEDFPDIDGTVIGGVNITINPAGGNQGKLSLDGNINQFMIGGQELSIDDVCGEPSVGCILELDLAYSRGTLTMDFLVGSEQPATWNTWVIVGGSVVPLWSLPIPAIPPTPVPLSFPGFPDLGVIGVLTTLQTSSGDIVCWDFDVVDTGPGP